MMEEDEFEKGRVEDELEEEEEKLEEEFQQQQQQQQHSVEHHQRQKRRRERQEEERERVKLRERQRRAVTSRILSGLRRHGNYGLPTRADINDVLSALAREAGWTVLPDGTTFRSPTAPLSHAAASSASSFSMALSSMGWESRMASSFLGVPLLATSTRGSRSLAPASVQSSIEAKHGENSNVKGNLTFKSPNKLKRTTSSQSRILAALQGDRDVKTSVINTDSSVDMTVDVVEEMEKDLPEEQMQEPPKLPEQDYAGTPYIPIYVMLPLGTLNMQNTLEDPEGLMQDLKILKSANVDGVMVDCWWGLVEAECPQRYDWSGYRELFRIVREAQLKLQVVMSFHKCGGNVGDDVNIPLPRWILEIGEVNPDIFFTDREGRRNSECLSWGVDKERVLRGRTGIEVYFDYMRSFRQEFDDFFEDGTITEIEIGLGPCGELRYPSYPEKHGWKYPGIGEFQCYDKYLQKSLRKTAETRGHLEWAKGPHNAGQYNSRPQDTDFFCDGGDWDSYYGRFFLCWYSQVLVDHGDRVLSLANLAFEGTRISAKISGIHWWYKTASHAAELTTGFYNSSNRDGYTPIANMFKKQNTTFNFTCVELRTTNQAEVSPEALTDPEGLVWQVLNAAWDGGIEVASENALPCYDRDGYNKILENAKPRKNPDGHHLVAFTYLRLNPDLFERENFLEFERFVKRLHGEAVFDLQL